MSIRSEQDAARAIEVLIANGFNPAMAKDLIARRRDLRDQFAMAALPWVVDCGSVTEAAQRSYDYADALLEARKC